MAEVKHTPGEWMHAHREGRDGMFNTQVFTEDGETIATLHWYPMPTTPQGVTGTYRDANARTVQAQWFVMVNITPTIANEYASRCPEDIPDAVYKHGLHSVSISTAHAMLSDAEYNSDKTAQDVGEYGMPLSVFNAYRALAKQLRKVIDSASSPSLRMIYKPTDEERTEIDVARMTAAAPEMLSALRRAVCALAHACECNGDAYLEAYQIALAALYKATGREA